MKIYNVTGYSLIVLHALASALSAPAEWGALAGAAFGLLYLVLVWFFGGVYLSDVIHLGIAHRALDYRPWFIKALTVFYNTAGIYINPVTWVNRHRLHHAYSDKPKDPNKLAGDGFWKTFYLTLFPYPCREDLAGDAICKTWPFRLVSNRYFAFFSQFSSFGLLWLVTRRLPYTITLWVGVRVFAAWINMIQNYWAHEKRYGARRYDDDDHAMNLGEWLPVTASFSASLQNNHHHSPRFLRLSHRDDEYDFGFITVKWMKALGLVQASPSGANKPPDVQLAKIGF